MIPPIVIPEVVGASPECFLSARKGSLSVFTKTMPFKSPTRVLLVTLESKPGVHGVRIRGARFFLN